MKHFPIDWEDFKTSKLCNAWVATAIVGASAIGAGATIFGADKAASAQENAANTAANTAMTQFNSTKASLSPYVQGGTDALNQIQDNSAFSTPATFTAPTAAEAAATPGYDFTQTQGLKAVQNSVAARGLGVSGAALKGAATFATGLANSTYGDTYTRSLNTFNANQASTSNAYNRLKGLVDTGESAAAGAGVIGQGAATTAAGAQIGAGNAAAAASNATGSAVSGAANNIGGYLAYQGLYGGGGDTTNGNQPLFDAQAASTRTAANGY